MAPASKDYKDIATAAADAQVLKPFTLQPSLRIVVTQFHGQMDISQQQLTSVYSRHSHVNRSARVMLCWKVQFLTL